MDKTLAKEMRLNKWAADLQDAEASGLGHREWCRMNNISYSTFKYRVRVVNLELNNRKNESNAIVSGAQFVEVPAVSYQAERSSHKADSNLISVELGTARINLPVCATPEQMKTVLEVLIHA